MIRDAAGPAVSTAYSYRGLDAAFIENDHLRIMLLPGKGGDVLEFRDKRTDVNLLWNADHNWVPPADRYVPAETKTTWLDHYPGGWQCNLPIAGFGMDFDGNAYGLHGESALVPWDATVTRDDDEAVSLRLTTDLVRYPFAIEREFTLRAGSSRIELSESIRNDGAVELEYVWQHHLALGRPFVGPEARLELPAATGVVEEYGDAYPNARLESGSTFEWPTAPAADGGTVDLRAFPDPDATVHDLAFATDLDEGQYVVRNDALDLSLNVSFPADLFESVWYWQAFGGFQESPYFNRNYTAGIEPTTAYPSRDIPDAQRATGTMKTLDPGETVSADLSLTTGRADEQPE